jgi:GAF domain-containing protein
MNPDLSRLTRHRHHCRQRGDGLVEGEAVTDNPVLDEAVAALRDATSLEDVQQIVRTAARQLVDAAGATVVLRDNDVCYYADEDAIAPLWKGQRFPINDCISGWAMLNQQHAVVPDIRLDARIPQQAYRPTFVRSLVMVPIRVQDPIGAIGAYWARPHQATDVQVALLSALATAAGPALTRFLSERPEGELLGISPSG